MSFVIRRRADDKNKKIYAHVKKKISQWGKGKEEIIKSNGKLNL